MRGSGSCSGLQAFENVISKAGIGFGCLGGFVTSRSPPQRKVGSPCVWTDWSSRKYLRNQGPLRIYAPWAEEESSSNCADAGEDFATFRPLAWSLSHCFRRSLGTVELPRSLGSVTSFGLLRSLWSVGCTG